ncbi:MAG: hypothetical protein AAFQ66_08725 [Pseudomonadota bacterium]
MKTDFIDTAKIPVDPAQQPSDLHKSFQTHNRSLSDADAQLWDAIFHDDVALAHAAMEAGANPQSKADPFFEDDAKEHPSRDVSALEYVGLAAAKNVAWYLRDVRGVAVHVPTDARSNLVRYNDDTFEHSHSHS